MSQKCEEAIGKTVRWFALFKYPLTLTELWRWLWLPNEKATVGDVIEFVREHKMMTMAPFVGEWGASDLELRAQRYLWAVRKQQKARRATWWLTMLPWVEGVALCNSLGYANADDNSDIDFFIIVHPHTIWLTRLVATLVLKTLGERPSKNNTRDKLCFSFYVTRDAMNLQNVALPNGDPYLTYWITQLMPLAGVKNIWSEFRQANKWVHDFLPNATEYYGCEANWYYQKLKTPRTNFAWLRVIDKAARYIQMHYLSVGLFAESQKSDSWVVMNDQMLKLHTTDRRAHYRDLWQKNVE